MIKKRPVSKKWCKESKCNKICYKNENLLTIKHQFEYEFSVEKNHGSGQYFPAKISKFITLCQDQSKSPYYDTKYLYLLELEIKILL